MALNSTAPPAPAPARRRLLSRLLSIFVLVIQSICILFGMIALLLTLSPLLIYRLILSYICSTLRPDLSHIVASQGANFLGELQPSALWNIVLRFKVRGKLNFEQVRKKFHDRCVLATRNGAGTGGSGGGGSLCYPELQQYCVRWAGYYFWKQEEMFRIEDHVVLYRHQQEGRNCTRRSFMSDEEIDELEAKYLHEPLAIDKSPWKILVSDNATGLEEEGDDTWYLVLFKFHHSLADGVSIFEALVKCSDDSQIPNAPVLPQRRSHANLCLRVFYALAFPFRGAYEFAKLLKLKSIRSPWDAMGPIMTTSAATTTTGIDEMATMANSHGIKVSRIKAIAAQLSISFTAVLLGGITGGIQKFLLSKMCLDQVPDYVVSEVPVPLSSQHPEGLTSSVSILSISLPITATNMNQRLGLIEQNLKERKDSSEAELTYFMINLSGLVSQTFARIYAGLLKLTPVGISVFRGPALPLKFDGHELFDMSYVVLSSYDLLINVLSYANVLTCSCIAANRQKALFSQGEIAEIVNQIEQEIMALENFNL